MKIAEECFLEICNKIYQNNDIICENNDNISIINYCKLHNYENNYLYKGNIIIEENIEGNIVKMCYEFSNKKSYICILHDNLEEKDILKYEYHLLNYIDKLFNKYKIDAFINSLNNKSKTKP
jgi:hypothetical protein